MGTNKCTQALTWLDQSSPQFPDQLSEILSWREFDESIGSPDTKDLVPIVEYLDKALDGLSPASFTFKRTHRKLQRICTFRKFLPSSHALNEGLEIDEHPFSSGGFSDVYKGKYNGLRVCVKKLRIADIDSGLTTKILFREALPWKRLKHPNIVPFIGVWIDPPQIVSEWMPNGNLTTFIKSNQKLELVSLLVDVAKGLDYMHSHGIIHGDMKGPNILVDGSGHARITDFGLVQDTLDAAFMAEGQSTRWTAPEILKEIGTPSTEADVFSFGMVMIEVFTGTVPFSDHTSPAAMIAIMSGKRPPRPAHLGLTDRLWELVVRCWDQDRRSRPPMLEVLLALGPLIHEHTRPSGPLLVTADVPTLVSDIRQLPKNRDPSDEYRPLLYALLTHRDLEPHINNFSEDDLQSFVALLDRALDHIPVTDDLFRKALRRLQSTCGNREVLPQSYLILGESLSKRGEPFAAGSSADAQVAEFDGKKVCIKTLRSNVQRKIYYGATVWKRLQHPNIVPFLGIHAKMPPFEIICDWMEGDRITGYLRKNQAVDPIGLLWDVAEGIHYLHSYNIVHGDLKAANVLIDNNGRARLADFGLASIVLGNQSVTSFPDANPTIATTWAAPEILNEGTLTKAGDVFTFAMVAAETFTGHPLSIYAAASNGEDLERPVGLRGDLWGLMQSCWNRNPVGRPTSLRLVNFFRPSFSKERESSETQTLASVVSVSEVTLANPESGKVGSYSDLSVVKPPMAENETNVLENTPGPDAHRILEQKLKSRKEARDWRRKPTDRRIGPTTTESNSPPLEVQVLEKKLGRRSLAKDTDKPGWRPTAEVTDERKALLEVLEAKVDERSGTQQIDEVQGHQEIPLEKFDRRTQAEGTEELEVRHRVLLKKLGRRKPVEDIGGR